VHWVEVLGRALGAVDQGLHLHSRQRTGDQRDPSQHCRSFDANAPIYNRLVQFKPGSTEITPALAERWEVSPDGKVFTFNLRHGVKWQSNKTFKSTRDFNADDVLFSFERQ
jgi:ABC-type transport system substrate-binding protein